MNFLKRGVPLTFAVLFGLATLAGLLVFPPLSDMILSWAAFLAAVALILGLVNLLTVHGKRALDRNPYSAVLVLSIVAVLALAVTDALDITTAGVEMAFNVIQVPLEAALASLLAFFLLFAGVRMLAHRLNWQSGLFVISALFFLVTRGPLPQRVAEAVQPVRAFADSVLVTAGMRGLLLGVALGVITLSLRLLSGLERPYSS